MPDPQPLRVCVEFLPGAEPPRGRLCAPGRPDRRFAGWTELFAALEGALRTGAPPDAGAAGGRSTEERSRA